jgi:hypothetical protein
LPVLIQKSRLVLAIPDISCSRHNGRRIEDDIASRRDYGWAFLLNILQGEEKMKATEHYVKARYDDKVIFTERKRKRKEHDVVKVWRRSQGLWQDHPVFQGMVAKEVIE